MNEFEILLENRWVVREKDSDMYYRVKNKLDDYKEFIKEKLGYSIIVNPKFIKLEKKPGMAESFMGILYFESVQEYKFLTIILMFLEDKGAEEQFILSQLTDYVESKYEGETKVDWTIYTHRRRLIKVLRYATEQYLIKVTDGDDSQFVNSESGEVLYENTGLSKYFLNHFNESILNYESFKDFEKSSLEDVNTDKGIFLRNRVYRKIFMSPVVYNGGAEDMDYLYIKKYRSVIENDIEKLFDSSFQVHKNGAMVLLSEDKNYKEVFPSDKNISDIVLLVNGDICARLKNGELIKAERDVITVSLPRFERIINETRNKNNHNFGKSYREMGINEFVEEVKEYMYYYRFIDMHDTEVDILPMVGKVVGGYKLEVGGQKSEVGNK
ncbi:MAG TPA: TIGR02678 family protein [Clostridiales bacterium]|nr:MAG: TIGR02678 family protein [Clostridiales bacterium GWD2_32_59]HAN09326.1 TIGR02678 family protein [Clostridiales bacterium]